MALSAGSVALDILPNVAGLSTKMRESASLAAKEASAGAAIIPKVDGAASGKKFGSGFLAEAGKVAAAAGALFAVKSVVDFGRESIAAFTDTAKAATVLQRSIGGTVEDSSRLNFAAKESGVSTDKFALSMKLLEKNVASVGGKTPAGAAALKQLGIDANDSTGKLKPMSELLPDIAAKFKDMPAGAEKSALAMKLFGKGGLDMLPMLNKGKEGIAALTEESDKYGNTITGPQAAAMKDNIAKQREFNAALEGVKIQLGAQLLPVLTSVTDSFRSKVLPAVLSVTTFLKEHANTVTTVAKVLIPLVAGLGLFVAAMNRGKAAVTAFQDVHKALGAVMDSTIGKQVAAWTKSLVTTVSGWARTTATTVAGWVKNVAVHVAGWVSTAAAHVAGWAVIAAVAVAGWVSTAASHVAGWVVIAAAHVAGWATTVATHVAGWAVTVATTVASMAVTVATTVGGWIAIAAASLASAASVALAWIIAFWPIALVIAAVIALVIVIVKNWDTIKAATAAVWTWIKDHIAAVWNAIVSAVKAAVAWVVAAVVGAWNWLSATTAAVWNGIKAIFSAVWAAIVGVVSGAVNGVRGAISAAWNAVTSLTSSAWEGIKGAVSGGISGVISFVSGLPGRILSGIGNMGSLLMSAGGDLIGGLISGISSAGGRLMSFITDFIKSHVPGPVLSFLGIASESKMFHEIGTHIPEGLALGIASGAGGVQAAANAMMPTIPAMPSFGSSASLAAAFSTGGTTFPGAKGSLTGGGAPTGPLVAVYPRANQSEEEIATIAASKLMFHLVSA